MSRELTLSEWRDYLDWIENQKRIALAEIKKLCGSNKHAPQMARSGRIEKDHEVEGTL